MPRNQDNCQERSFEIFLKKCDAQWTLSGRWESDPLPSPWQGDVLPVNYARDNVKYTKKRPFAQVRHNYLLCAYSVSLLRFSTGVVCSTPWPRLNM